MEVPNSSLAQHKRFQNRNRDIISSLPDAVICNILSFLPTKYVVGTSILSRRWRYTWTSVPVLDFDDTLISHPETAKRSKEQCFMQFVNRVLLLHCDKIKTLRYKVVNIPDRLMDHHTNLWICSAVMRNIEELDLDCKSIELPQILFNCKTIKILKLHDNIQFKIIATVSLPRLKVLHIKRVSVANLEKILLGCPTLEELVVCRDVVDYHATTLYVVSSSLKRLTIYQKYMMRGLDPRSVVINAPKLEFFELEDHVSRYFTVMKVSSPLEASIDVRSSCTNYALQLLRRITNVSVLHLSAYTLRALFRASDDKYPWLRFLTRLKIGAIGYGWLMLPKILKWSPNLEAFTLYKVNDTIPQETIFKEESSVPGCFLSSLESVELKRFGGNKAEMEVLKYFLKNASVLKILKISISGTTFQREAEILRMLIMFPRASTACKILLTLQQICFALSLIINIVFRIPALDQRLVVFSVYNTNVLNLTHIRSYLAVLILKIIGLIKKYQQSNKEEVDLGFKCRLYMACSIDIDLYTQFRRMDTSTIRGGSKQKGKNVISKLPNHLISHILSLLPTKHAVGTSRLSKRWRYKWAKVPVLDFDDTILFDYLKGGKYRIGGVSFINFVDRVLVRTFNTPIYKFCLKCSRRRVFHLTAWVNTALKHQLREIDLRIDVAKNFRLPAAFFSCQTLEVLKLGKNFELHVPESFCFPHLKTLHLDSIDFLEDSTFHKFISSCPLLEDLVLLECKVEFIKLLKMSAPALKYLSMDFFSYEHYDDYESSDSDADYYAGNGNEEWQRKIVVDAPKLEVFKYKDHVEEGYSFGNLHDLDRVKIDVKLSKGNREDNDDGKSATELLRSISSAKCLKLSRDSLEVLSLVKSQDVPMFNNLVTLILPCTEHCGFLLPKLLEQSPNLEALVFGKKKTMYLDIISQKNFKWEPPSQVPECVSHHLETVQMLGLDGHEEVLKFAKYLQENGKVTINWLSSKK
ncbi:putative F-box/LRR-repeat protein At3g42770 [Mercurialis annua]|uniref:putative F-box/LRR-repeat protein At3g42770 n=1 Tax=Mercurialis annua TaxID=3986 RepID=UPI0024AE2896|nr:putative F-box/LRR-repeat protein At3g42770 [Mercurialis annua]